jgi:hypothetical protein
MKTFIGNPVIDVRQRNVGSYEIPAIANWMFSTNDLRPIAIDAADRRNMMLACSNDLVAAQAVIERLKPILNDVDRYRSALAEFGSWLDSIAIDDDLIRRALPTKIKDDVIETTRDAVESFIIEQSESGAWKVGEWITTNDLMSRFKLWLDHAESFQGFHSQNLLITGLRRAATRGWVRDERQYVGRTRTRGWTLTKSFAESSPSPIPGEVDFFAQPVVEIDRGRNLLERMKAARIKQGRLH